MNTKSIAFASIVTLAAFSGSAFAASLMPESGVGPLFQNEPVRHSTLTRAEVQAQAIQDRPASGDHNGLTQTASSDKTRTEVRAELRQALNNGYHVSSGIQN